MLNVESYLFLNTASSFSHAEFKTRYPDYLQSGFIRTILETYTGFPKGHTQTMHTEVKYSIAGVEFQPAKQFILSSFVLCFYLSRWSNGLRHLTCSQRTVGSIPT